MSHQFCPPKALRSPTMHSDGHGPLSLGAISISEISEKTPYIRYIAVFGCEELDFRESYEFFVGLSSRLASARRDSISIVCEGV